MDISPVLKNWLLDNPRLSGDISRVIARSKNNILIKLTKEEGGPDQGNLKHFVNVFQIYKSSTEILGI